MALNSWRSDYQNTTVPNNIIISNYDTGDYFYKKTSYLRCRNITVGYTVPMKNKAVRHLRVYADVNNPFIVTNWTGLDPETDQNLTSYPNVRSFSLGLEIRF